ncbi:MAG: alpha-glucosidase [Spirochaetales bacterium]|nr:alpha-glucosidase [Spirochaetales bacterium]
MKKNWLWWKHGVIYQIYPRSFYDSNGDGIGDIKGIIKKLDYLADLGVDGIWTSPINQSPMYDFGYDISDYYKIDPLFGTDKDFDTLIKEAHKRNIRIILDLVLNHSSHEHQWFKESASSPDNPKKDWYVWHDGIKGKPPNNWLGMFGGKAWEWSPIRRQFYLHSFLKEQPDLNWRNRELREAVYEMIRFWLDKGVDGFRLDVINFLLKDPQFRSNSFAFGPNPRPYDLQNHLHDRNQPDNHDIMKELRKVTDSYPDRMLVGEVYAPFPDPLLSAEYLGNGKDELHLAFNFAIIHEKKWHARVYYSYLHNWYKSLPKDGWPCIVLSNHDQSRSRARFGPGKQGLLRSKVAAAFLLTVKGTPFIYYGEEIGMDDGKIKKDQIRDPVGKKYWPFNKGRDPERTPMLWSGEKNAGFTCGVPWLPVNEDWEHTNVEIQNNDPLSLLNFYKSLLTLRKEKKSLMQGEWLPLNEGKENYLLYERKWEDESLLILLNFDKKEQKVTLPAQDWKILLSTAKRERTHHSAYIFPEAYEVIIMEKNKE